MHWQRFEPHPEWAAFVAAGGATLSGSSWIWYPEGNPAVDAPVAARYLRLGFDLPAGRVRSCKLLLHCDDAATAYLNGSKIAESNDWAAGAESTGFQNLLREGRNLLAIGAENSPSNVTKNPAGLICVLEVQFSDGTTRVYRSDDRWKASQSDLRGWTDVSFDDSNWPRAMIVGALGDAPWGRVGEADSGIGPQAAGIPGGVRIIYMLRPSIIVVRALVPQAVYAVKLFDPVSGRFSSLPEIRADSAGDCKCAPPIGWDHDWVLVLDRR